MIKLCIIGSGNVGQHLISAFLQSQKSGSAIELVQVYSRRHSDLVSLMDLDKITSDFNQLVDADLYIISVSDDAISEVSNQLPFKNRLVVHTSGSVSIDDLNLNNRKGVFYPLQTFSKNKPVDFSSIPICLESENASDYQVLEKVAKIISNKTYPINSHQRKSLHIAAVFVNNFTNHLYHLADDICSENQVPFEILKPLIKETAEKVMVLTPDEAQTGPAKRLDLKTINTHLDYLTDGNQKKIYELLTQSIIAHGQKL